MMTRLASIFHNDRRLGPPGRNGAAGRLANAPGVAAVRSVVRGVAFDAVGATVANGVGDPAQDGRGAFICAEYSRHVFIHTEIAPGAPPR